MTRSQWLELHDEFEGVGAHELNRRYDHVDGGDWDEGLRDLVEVSRQLTPALFRAQSFLAVSPVRFDGADISHHQDDAGPIDWPTLRAASVGAWVATKATQSLAYVDPTFAAHRAQMGAQGFRHRLHYHWLSSTTDPVAQARHFLETVGDWFDGEGSMLDAEEHGITAAMVLEWCHEVEAERRRPSSVYSGAYVAGGTIWQSTQIRTSPFGDRPMHLAAYTTEAKAKALPGVAAYPWSAWQHSSNGPVPGVTGRCDMNRVDLAANYDIACGLTFPPPLPQPETDMALIITNDADHDGHPALAQSWLMMDDGTKRELDVVEKAVRGNTIAERVGNAQLDAIPDWVKGDGTVDQVARDEAAHANEAVTRIASTISDIRMGGQRIADAGGH